MIEDKLYIDLNKHEKFEGFTSQLHDFIKSIRTADHISITDKHKVSLTHSLPVPVIKSKVPSTERKAVSNWSEEQVKEWFNNTKISNLIAENLAPCDGVLLEQLYATMTEVPEFFHSILRSDSKASLKDIVVFTSALKALFK